MKPRKGYAKLMANVKPAVLLGALLFVPSSFAANPPPVKPTELDPSILDMETTPEERMSFGPGADMPAVPENGNENPEDLLKSSPLASPSKQGKTASVHATDGMPAKLKEIPGTPKKAYPAQELPPAPPPPAAAAPAPSANQLTPEAPVEIPTETSEIKAEAAPAPTDATPLPDATVPGEPPAEAPVAEEPPPPADETSTKKWDRHVPTYDRERPNWAFDVHGSIKALGSTDFRSDDGAGNIAEYRTSSFGLGFDWEPAAIQSVGVFSVGLTSNLYILSNSNDVRDPEGNLTKGPLSIYSFGVRAMYQARWFDAQPLVPYAGFEAQQIHYSFADYSELGSGWTLSTGPVFGALLLLNWMEPSAAHNLWAETDIKRSYVFAEMKLMTAGLADLSVDGAALYFGLRMEY